VTKPSYLGLLNAIAVGEARGEELFAAWAATTKDDELRPLLHTVCLREAEHALAFAKRLDELGYGVLDRDDPKHAGRLAVAADPAVSDVEKLERLGFAREEVEPDIFGQFFADTTIDPLTGGLLGRYICEERDTRRRLVAAHRARATKKPARRPRTRATA